MQVNQSNEANNTETNIWEYHMAHLKTVTNRNKEPKAQREINHVRGIDEKDMAQNYSSLSNWNRKKKRKIGGSPEYLMTYILLLKRLMTSYGFE